MTKEERKEAIIYIIEGLVKLGVIAIKDDEQEDEQNQPCSDELSRLQSIYPT